MRGVAILAVAVAVWAIVQLWAPTWIAGVFGIVAAASVGLGLQRFGPRAMEKVAGLSPVRATVESDAARLSDGWSMLLDGDLPEKGRPVGGDSLRAREWMVGLGAADCGDTYLRLVIEGRSSSTVRLSNVRASILDRRPPITKTSISSPSGGDNEIQMFGLDLDEDAPVARVLESDPIYIVQVDPPFGGPYFFKRQATVVRDEIVVYSVMARSTRDCVEWTLEVDLVVDGKERKMALDNGGQPFRTSPRLESAETEWNWAWYEPPPRFLDVTEQNREIRASTESELPPPP